MKHKVWLTLGSNLDRETCYPAGVRLIASHYEVELMSMVYETVPVDMVDAPDFFNGALLLRTEQDPSEVKATLITQVEAPLGRRQSAGGPFKPRTFDADIALWNDEVFTLGPRPVPDPGILKYLHMARPLADISPDHRYPGDGRTLAEIAADLEKSGPLPRPRPDIILDLT